MHWKVNTFGYDRLDIYHIITYPYSMAAKGDNVIALHECDRLI